jgi:uncharacterized membrane protein YdbT with pleckstrin-like domain
MSNLLPGENLVLKAHQHWITFVRAMVFPVVILVLVVLADFSFLGPGGLYVPKLRTYLTLIVVALAILWLIVVWIRWQSVSYTLTDQRIKIEAGVFGREEKIIPIDRVQDCTTRQSIFGRMLGYGTVEVDAAGAQGAEILVNLPKPGQFRDQVFVHSEKRRGGPESAPPPVAANPSGI